MSIKNRTRLGRKRIMAGMLAAVIFVSLFAPKAVLAETPADDGALVSEEELANEALRDQTGDEFADNEAFMADGWDDSLYLNTASEGGADEGAGVPEGGSGGAGVALYFIPHQDDDILTFSGGIIRDLHNGLEVHVVLCTDGRNSKVFSEINAERKKSGKEALTVSEFIAARDQEFRGSMTALGVKPENIHIPGDRLYDGTTATNMDRLKRLIQRYVNAYPGAQIRANMPVAGEISAHTDHADIGICAVDLMKQGLISDLLLFMDSYKYSDYRENGLPELTAVPADYEEEWSVIERIRFNSAVRAYHYGSEYGIGYRSSGRLFSALLKDPHSYCYPCHPNNVSQFGGSQRYETAQFAANGTALDRKVEANFMAVPAEDILIRNQVVIAPNKGNGVDPDSKGSKTKPGGTLVLAYGGNFPDALAATSLGVEIMLTKTGVLAPEARAEILRTLPGRIVIMGSTGVVSDNVIQAINELGATVTPSELLEYYGAADAVALVYHPEIIRCGGGSRYETAEALVRNFGYHSVTHSVIVTTGANYADAVSIAPYAAKTATPIVLATSKGELTDSSYRLLESFGEQCSHAIIIGGTSVVSEACARKIENIGLAVTRLAGRDRYETSTAVAEFCLAEDVGLDMSCPSLAIGNNFPDALIAGPIAANSHSVLILCHTNPQKWSSGLRLLAARKEEISAAGRQVFVFGGENVVPRGTIEMVLCAVS